MPELFCNYLYSHRNSLPMRLLLVGMFCFSTAFSQNNGFDQSGADDRGDFARLVLRIREGDWTRATEILRILDTVNLLQRISGTNDNILFISLHPDLPIGADFTVIGGQEIPPGIVKMSLEQLSFVSELVRRAPKLLQGEGVLTHHPLFQALLIYDRLALKPVAAVDFKVYQLKLYLMVKELGMDPNGQSRSALMPSGITLPIPLLLAAHSAFRAIAFLRDNFGVSLTHSLSAEFIPLIAREMAIHKYRIVGTNRNDRTLSNDSAGVNWLRLRMLIDLIQLRLGTDRQQIIITAKELLRGEEWGPFGINKIAKQSIPKPLSTDKRENGTALPPRVLGGVGRDQPSLSGEVHFWSNKRNSFRISYCSMLFEQTRGL